MDSIDITPIILLWIVLEMGIRISKRDGKLDHNAVCSCVVEELRSAIWCYGEEISTNGVAFFPDLIFAQFVKLFVIIFRPSPFHSHTVC